MNAHAALARDSSDVAPAAIAYRAAYAVLAVAIVGASIAAPHNDAALALERFIGSSIVRDRSIATHLGPETFVATGSASGAVGWLGGLVAYATTGGSGILATILSALVALGTFALVEQRARRLGGRIFSLGAVALACACSLGSFGVGGGIFTAAFAIALAELFDRRGPRNQVAAAILAWVWCNVAAQGLLAPLLAAVFALGASLEGRSAAERRGRWISCAGTLLAVLATPGILAYPAIAFEELRLDRSLVGIVAFHPMDVAPTAYRVGFLALAFVAFAVGVRRKHALDALVFVCATLLALANGAYLPVFGVLVAPLLAASAAAAFGTLAESSVGSLRGDRIVALAAALVTLPIAASAMPFAQRYRAPAYALASALASDGRPHRLYCSNVDWCDAALSGPPSRTRVFMDGRVGAYPQIVRDDQHDISRLSNHWRRTLRVHGIDAMLLRIDRQLAGLIALSPEWHVVASDDEAVLYERSVANP